MGSWKRWATCLVLLAVILGGCASTRIVSERDPALADPGYRVLMVDASLQDQAMGHAVEAAFVEEMRSVGLTAHPASELFFSRREYGAAERDQIFDDRGVEAVLVITEVGSGLYSEYVPKTRKWTTTVTETDDGLEETVTETVSGGFERPVGAWAAHVADLYDRSSQQIVWYAEAASEGKGTTNWEKLAQSAGTELVRQLALDGMLAVPTAAFQSDFQRLNSTQ